MWRGTTGRCSRGPGWRRRPALHRPGQHGVVEAAWKARAATDTPIQPPPAHPLSGAEAIVGTGATVREFWAWALSDLRENVARSRLAEFLVARAVGAGAPLRVEWEPYDVLTPSGVTVEVKSAPSCRRGRSGGCRASRLVACAPVRGATGAASPERRVCTPMCTSSRLSRRRGTGTTTRSTWTGGSSTSCPGTGWPS